MPDLRGYQSAARDGQLITNWRLNLNYARGENKPPDASLLNAIIALQLAPQWQRVWGYDELARGVYQIGTAPWNETDIAKPEPLTDLMVIKVTAWLQAENIMVRTGVAHEAILHVADEIRYHPVRDYLQQCSQRWDGRARIGKWLIDYAGAQDTTFTRAAGRKWLISAVARIYQPGCKADHMLLLEGAQGIGKSRAAKILGGDWFTDDVPTLESQNAALAVSRHWIVELSELTAMRKSMVETVKSFLSRTHDKFRPAYGRELVNYPRQCAFVGTINPEDGGYLTDRTGNRRFWPVRCGEYRIDELTRDRDQIWAEATLAYLNQESWWMDSADLNLAAAREQEKRLQSDSWTETVSRALAEMRRLDAKHPAGGPGVTLGELYANMGIAIDKRGRREDLRLSAILRQLGYMPAKIRRPDENGNSRYVYGFAEPIHFDGTDEPDALAE